MHWWTKILPYFFIAWFARRYCERYEIHGQQWAGPYKDCLIRIPEKNKRNNIFETIWYRLKHFYLMRQWKKLTKVYRNLPYRNGEYQVPEEKIIPLRNKAEEIQHKINQVRKILKRKK